MSKISQELIDLAVPIINKIAKSRQTRNIFAYFDKEDIFQEIWLLCLDALQRYNPENGELENFLSKHVCHRMKNLKRDKYFRPEKKLSLLHKVADRINIVNALPIGNSDISNIAKPIFQSAHIYNPLDYCIAEELKEYITNNLPNNLKEQFHSLIAGDKIKKRTLQILRENISILIEKFNGEQNQSTTS